MNQIEFADAAAIQFIHSASHHLVYLYKQQAIHSFYLISLNK